MGEHNSPFFKAGFEDGKADTERLRSCPPRDPAGMDPDREWSSMYRRGYERTFSPSRHSCPLCAGKAA